MIDFSTYRLRLGSYNISGWRDTWKHKSRAKCLNFSANLFEPSTFLSINLYNGDCSVIIRVSGSKRIWYPAFLLICYHYLILILTLLALQQHIVGIHPGDVVPERFVSSLSSGKGLSFLGTVLVKIAYFCLFSNILIRRSYNNCTRIRYPKAKKTWQ